MAENKDLQSLPEVRAAVAALSPEDRELLAAVQASPFKLTTPEQFKEFAANTDYFVFEPNVRDLNDLGLRFIAQHTDILLTPELLSAIDPVPFGQYAAKEEQGHFTEHGYISLSGEFTYFAAFALFCRMRPPKATTLPEIVCTGKMTLPQNLSCNLPSSVL